MRTTWMVTCPGLRQRAAVIKASTRCTPRSNAEIMLYAEGFGLAKPLSGKYTQRHQPWCTVEVPTR